MRLFRTSAILIGVARALCAQAQQGDIPKTFTIPETRSAYVKREVMIPMRDGVRLHTVIVIPKGAKDAPMVLTRTPYNASKRAVRNESPHMLALLPLADEVFVAGGYIRVYQDVRGKYGSEGEYVMTKPVRGTLNTTGTDYATDPIMLDIRQAPGRC
jgi:predicted acyl esterase